MEKKAVLIGALDTKGHEFQFVKDTLQACGMDAFVVDTGVLGEPLFKPDVSADEVARAGGSSIEELRRQNDRGTAVAVMTRGAANIAVQLEKQGNIGGVFGMGGTAGTTVAASAHAGSSDRRAEAARVHRSLGEYKALCGREGHFDDVLRCRHRRH